MTNQYPQSSKENRTKSIKEGKKIYDGIPCKKCGSTQKHVSSYSCVKCNVDRNLSKLYDDDLMAPYRTKEKQQKYFEENKDKRNGYKRKYSLGRYGLTVEEYENMYTNQKGKCSICGGQPKRKNLSVDHCHKTSKVRGLLCEKCNVGLGSFGDNITFLKNAILYLEKN